MRFQGMPFSFLPFFDPVTDQADIFALAFFASTGFFMGFSLDDKTAPGEFFYGPAWIFYISYHLDLIEQVLSVFVKIFLYIKRSDRAIHFLSGCNNLLYSPFVKGKAFFTQKILIIGIFLAPLTAVSNILFPKQEFDLYRRGERPGSLNL